MAVRTVDRSTGEIIAGPVGYADSLLDNTTKSVDIGRNERRALRYRLQRTASLLLPHDRVAGCMVRCSSGGVSLRLSPSKQIATYQGLQPCGSVWHCPVCSAKISNTRRDELNKLLSWAREKGYAPMMLTLTMSHHAGDSLRDSLEALKAAKKRFHQSRTWRGIEPAIVGHVTATELTYGVNGWHPHFHIILIFAEQYAGAAEDLLESARVVWSAALYGPKKLGPGGVRMFCNENGYHVQDAQQAGEYVGKFGAAEEVALTGSKKARRAGATPFQLLADAGSYSNPSSCAAGLRFIEYAEVMAGRRQLVWSRGLKLRAAVADLSDEDVAAADEIADSIEVISIPARLWRKVAAGGHQAELLAVCEQGGFDYVEMWLIALEVQTTLDRGHHGEDG